MARPRATEKKPNKVQSRFLAMIAQSGPLMKTYITDKRDCIYSLAAGKREIPNVTAEKLIANGWVVPQKDGMFEDCQTWRAKTPADR